MKVVVLGLGLIGGSLARELSRAGHTVVGDDVDAASVASALEAGAIRVRGGIDSDAATADVVVLATPVDTTAALLRQQARALATVPLVMDVGSAKAVIAAAATAAGLAHNFVGAHPLAGDHRAGWSASRHGLFSDATVYLCPDPDAHAPAVTRATQFWQAVGARPMLLTAVEHDARLAWSSHLPQFAATALALTLAAHGTSRRELGPGGLDATRLAGSDPTMWSAIAMHNTDALVAGLDALAAQLDALRAAIGERRSDSLRARLVAAREWSDNSSPANGGSRPATGELDAATPPDAR